LALARVTVEKSLEGGHQQREKRDLLGPSQLFQLSRYLFSNPELHPRAAIGLKEGTRPIGRELQDGRSARESLLPELPVRFTLIARHHLLLPADEIGVFRSEGRELHPGAFALGRIEDAQLLH